MKSSFDIITAETINKIVQANPQKIYDAVKGAYTQHGKKLAVNPPSYFLRFPDKEKSRIIALPALIVENPRVAGIKWVSSNPDNINVGLKRASAVIILNNYDTGYPVACLEGSVISALRTVYSAVLVSNLLVRWRQKVVSIIGNGYISEQFIRTLFVQGNDLETIKLFDINTNASNKLKEVICELSSKVNIEIVSSLKDAIVESDLIFFSTISIEPYITELSWFSHNPLILNISLRDLSAEIILRCNNVVDDIEHVLNANTSPHLALQLKGDVEFINCNVSQLIDGYNKFDISKPIIFSPMGMGILDLAVANYIYEEAKGSNSQIEIKNFF
jgi:ornithine cyclodeaminase